MSVESGVLCTVCHFTSLSMLHKQHLVGHIPSFFHTEGKLALDPADPLLPRTEELISHTINVLQTRHTPLLGGCARKGKIPVLWAWETVTKALLIHSLRHVYHAAAAVNGHCSNGGEQGVCGPCLLGTRSFSGRL